MTDERRDREREAVEHYRRAVDDALQQLEWCIGYLYAIRKGRVSAALARNRRFIRSNLPDRSEASRAD